MIICVCVDRSIFTIKDDSILRLGAGTLSTSELCRTICDFEGPVRLLSGHRGYFLHSVWMGPIPIFGLLIRGSAFMSSLSIVLRIIGRIQWMSLFFLIFLPWYWMISRIFQRGHSIGKSKRNPVDPNVVCEHQHQFLLVSTKANIGMDGLS